MERAREPKSDALRALYWRDEILQLMFWFRGEGFGEAIDPALLERFLGVQAQLAIQYLDHLVGDGLLERTPDGLYSLTQQGQAHGARAFAEQVADPQARLLGRLTNRTA